MESLLLRWKNTSRNTNSKSMFPLRWPFLVGVCSLSLSHLSMCVPSFLVVLSRAGSLRYLLCFINGEWESQVQTPQSLPFWSLPSKRLTWLLREPWFSFLDKKPRWRWAAFGVNLEVSVTSFLFLLVRNITSTVLRTRKYPHLQRFEKMELHLAENF